MSTITLLPRDAAWTDGLAESSPAVDVVPVTGFSAPRVRPHSSDLRRERPVRSEGASCITERPAVRHEIRPARPTVHRRPGPAGPVRLTHRGRVVVVALFLAALAGLMVALSGPVIATLSGGHGPQVRIVEVQAGQTLYDIAGSVARPGQVNEMVYRIEELNSLPDSDISVGQRLAVPRG